jgi:1,4-dihydroxy-2-naphthoyl-CoA synthase
VSQESPEPVRYERRGTAALVTIDRQHRRNAVDGPTAALLHEAYLRFEADEEARVMVLTGAGDVSFCAGADLKAQGSFVDRLMSEEGPMGFTRLTPSKPTIAAISGFALAGGLARDPQRTMLADRRAAIEGLGMALADGLALEAKAGPEVFEDGARGAARFAAGEGRGGAGAGA